MNLHRHNPDTLRAFAAERVRQADRAKRRRRVLTELLFTLLIFTLGALLFRSLAGAWIASHFTP